MWRRQWCSCCLVILVLVWLMCPHLADAGPKGKGGKGGFTGKGVTKGIAKPKKLDIPVGTKGKKTDVGSKPWLDDVVQQHFGPNVKYTVVKTSVPQKVKSANAALKNVLKKYKDVIPTDAVETDVAPGYKSLTKRSPSQTTAAGLSANQVAKVLKLPSLPSGKNYEWLHCSGWLFGDTIPDGIGVDTPQRAANLVLGTRFSNEAMIPYEVSLQHLADTCKKTNWHLTCLPNRDARSPFLASTIRWAVSTTKKKHCFVKDFDAFLMAPDPKKPDQADAADEISTPCCV